MLNFTINLALWLWGFWIFYVLVMGFYRAYLAKRLSNFLILLALPFVLVAFLVDVLSNLVIAPVVFLDIPREWLVTTRLQRYQGHESGWRKSIAAFVCDKMLDVFDPTGNHC